ncbi:MAG: hypothetical protein J2P57_25075 [Acidimicrobiaceae bacterium]|nr:hypothetical protein [Acidimicrobiaceae bacterium]
MVALAAATTVGLAACGGGQKPPHVASLGTSTTSVANGGTSGGTFTPPGSGGSSATTVPKRDPTRLLSEWTACMRSHGDPNQAQPTVDANGAIHAVDPAGYFGPIAGPTGHAPTGAGVTCLAYLTAASDALHGGEPLQVPDPATGDKFAACMRAHGVPNYPDPGGGPASVSPGSSKPNAKSPSFENAARVCAQKYPGAASLGGPATLQAGQIEIDNPDGSVRLVFVGAT